MDLWQKVEIAGMVAGLIYIWLEYRANIWMWVAGIVMPAIYIYVYLHEGVYANVGINLYFIVAGIYGLWAWKRGRSSSSAENGRKPLEITRIPRRVWLPALSVGAALTLGIAWLLIHFTDSTEPWFDAFTTGYSIVGLWMLARKWADQWLVWIVVDTIYTTMFLYKQMYPTAAMYAVFTIVAVLGFFKWVGACPRRANI
jgi:nicotinamide mononucleotide transporter